MNKWTWEGNENDKTGYAVSEKTHYFAEKLRQLAGEMED